MGLPDFEVKLNAKGQLTAGRPDGPWCDFCSTTLATGWFMAREFDHPIETPRGIVNIHYGAMWAACDTCAGLVEAEEWGLLLEVSVATFVNTHSGARLSVEDVRQMIGTLHELFRIHLLPGGRHPL